MMLRRPFALVSLVVAAVVAAPGGPLPAAAAPPAPPPKSPVATGLGGGVAGVAGGAAQAGIGVPRQGGNAVGGAGAGAATLGVPEPFSSGIGGGGFFVFYDARSRTVRTLDGRETAPRSMGENAFINPATGLPYDFQEARVSGISAGVPGTPLLWQTALRQWGTISWRDAPRPATRG